MYGLTIQKIVESVTKKMSPRRQKYECFSLQFQGRQEAEATTLQLQPTGHNFERKSPLVCVLLLFQFWHVYELTRRKTAECH